MKKWAAQIETQRRRYREHHASSGSWGPGRATARDSDGSRQGGTSATEFSFMRDHPALENPYKNAEEEDAEEEEEEEGAGEGPRASGPAAARNASNGSLRAQPPRFQPGTLASAPLTLRTQQLQGHRDGPGVAMSPASGTTPGTAGMPQDSYFSPLNESPMSGSQRTSDGSSLGMYPFPRQNTTPNGGGAPGYYNVTPEDDAGYARGQARFTAPAMAGRQREASNASSASSSAAGTPRPGPPPPPPGTRGMHSAQQLPMPPRHRSASSPDIHHQRPSPYPRGPSPAVPEVPPQYSGPLYPGLGHSAVPRSQNSSPAIGLPRMPPLQQQQQQQRSPNPTPTLATPSAYPPTATPHSPSPPEPPSQLRVRVICPSAAQTLTLVVPLTITYQSLKDRIDAKLQRSTNLTLGDKGPREAMVKLKYEDEQGDFVSITSDEDVREAFEWGWERTGAAAPGLGGMGEVELFCQR